ncbi:MAG: type II toxin-antitoxin system VapC family toxin [Chloroflexota bacterium]
MSILLDTHIFLWYISGDKRIPNFILQEIRSPANTVFLSVVSLWEIIIKYQLDKLPLPESPELYIPAQRLNHKIMNLEIDEASVKWLIELPPVHRDPFDRLLICRANEHAFMLATIDRLFKEYSVSILQPKDSEDET